MLPSCGIFAQTQPLGAPSGSPNSYLRSFTLRIDQPFLKKTSLLDDLLWVVGLVAVDHLEGLHLGHVEHGERVGVGIDVQYSHIALRHLTMHYRERNQLLEIMSYKVDRCLARYSPRA